MRMKLPVFLGLLFIALQMSAQGQKSMLAELAGKAMAFADSSRAVAPWPLKSTTLRVIIDSDAANEVDDQYAIALALGYPERLHVEGFVAAHYGIRGGSGGVERSRKSIIEVLEKSGSKDPFIVKNGSDPLVYLDRIQQSEGVDFIIEKARTATPENPIWVIALGPATDVAAAILKDPSITNRIVVLWHGRSKWPLQCWNFNAYNDIKAVQVLFDSPVRLILFDTGTYLTMPMEESQKKIMPNGDMGRYLHDIRLKSAYARQPDKGLFDMGDIAVLIDPTITKWEIIDIPSIGHDLRYDFTTKRGKFVRIYDIDRKSCFDLLDQALKKLKQ